MITQKNEFKGIDVNLEISLQEYGLIVTWDCENNEYFCIYRNGDYFFPGSIDESEIIESLELDQNGLLSFVGMNYNEWINSTPVNKIFDLYHYFGPENIFGICYGEPYTNEEIKELTGIEL
jgi:hypothetical protein